MGKWQMSEMLEAKPCPAGECDAQVYSVGELAFCPKCRAKNPNFRLKTEVTRVKREIKVNMETGVIKW